MAVFANLVQSNMMNSANMHRLVILGQTPPPWHGQAVATQILFDHDWPGFEVDRIRMDFSDEMQEVGRFQFKKLRRLHDIILKTRESLGRSNESILFYPPASANWIPFLRDVMFLIFVRGKAAKTVFIYHASGLAEFTQRCILRRCLGRLAYGNADMALEVAQEKTAPHAVFQSKSYEWCPCAIAVPEIDRQPRVIKSPLQVLFIGSLQEGKGVLEILKTAAILKEHAEAANIQINIVGKWFSSDFEQEALAMLRQLDVSQIVNFSGQLIGDAKWQAYAKADVFFFPTHYQSEATPIVLMEALGMGCPIISTEWAGIPAMLEGCHAAQLFPIRSPEKYADALIECKHEIDQDKNLSACAKAFYQENFLPKKFVERIENALRKI
jgi:glycosyltransferase involved in cell wall biosynthesis